MPYRAKKATSIDGNDLQGLKSDVRDLAKHVEDEFAEIASAFQNPDPMQIRTAVPPKPRVGMVVYADGTHWNPGSGEGVYRYGSDAAWHFLG